MSHLILHCPSTDSLPLALWQLFFCLRPLAQALGSCPVSGALCFSQCFDSSEGVDRKQQQYLAPIESVSAWCYNSGLRGLGQVEIVFPGV